MRDFKEFIEKIIDKKYIFRIKSCEDLEYFTLGCFIAKAIYKQIDTKLDDFTLFYEYTNHIYPTTYRKRWGKILDYNSKDVLDSFTLFSSLYNSFSQTDIGILYEQDNNNPMYSVKEKLLDVDSFLKLMLKIKESPESFGIRNINHFDQIYNGLFIYGDCYKGEAFFKDLNDSTFINFYEPNSEFKKYIVNQNPLLPVNDYLSIIKYLTTEENEMELFLELFNGYTSSRSVV